jgi:hypothetical protein
MKDINSVIQDLIAEHGEWVTLSKACEVLGTPKAEIESWGAETKISGCGQTLYSLAGLFQTAITREPEEIQRKPRIYTPREKSVPTMPREERDAKILAQYEIFVDKALRLWENKIPEWLSSSDEIRRLQERKAKVLRVIRQKVEHEEAKVAASLVAVAQEQ